MKDIAIYAVSENISPSTVQRFKSCIRQSNCKYTYDIILIKGSLGQKEQFKEFNKSKLLNRITKKLIKKEYQVLIQTDIDVITPPHLMNISYEMSMDGNYVHNEMARVDPKRDKIFKNLPESYKDIDWHKYKQVMKKRWIDAAGCWNATTRENWVKTGGWNEEFVAWSREDCFHKEMVVKYSGLKIMTLKLPLMHYDHPQRTKDNRRHNDVVRTKSRKQGFKNWLI